MIFDLEQTFYCFYIKYHFTICECTFISKNIFWIWEKIFFFIKSNEPLGTIMKVQFTSLMVMGHV
jgi:hypothetical protein